METKYGFAPSRFWGQRPPASSILTAAKPHPGFWATTWRFWFFQIGPGMTSGEAVSVGGGFFFWKILVFRGHFWRTSHAAIAQSLVPVESQHSELHFHVEIYLSIGRVTSIMGDRKCAWKIFRLRDTISGTSPEAAAVKFCTLIYPTLNLKGAKIRLHSY